MSHLLPGQRKCWSEPSALSAIGGNVTAVCIEMAAVFSHYKSHDTPSHYRGLPFLPRDAIQAIDGGLVGAFDVLKSLVMVFRETAA